MSTQIDLDPKHLAGNPFIGATDRTPRPTHDGAFGPSGREDLKRDQERWDFAKAWDDDNKRRQQERFDKVAQDRENDRLARVAEDAAKYEDVLRKRYLAADPLATEADFQKDLPEIKRQTRIQAALAEPNQSRDGWLAGSRAAI